MLGSRAGIFILLANWAPALRQEGELAEGHVRVSGCLEFRAHWSFGHRHGVQQSTGEGCLCIGLSTPLTIPGKAILDQALLLAKGGYLGE